MCLRYYFILILVGLKLFISTVAEFNIGVISNKLNVCCDHISCNLTSFVEHNVDARPVVSLV